MVLPVNARSHLFGSAEDANSRLAGPPGEALARATGNQRTAVDRWQAHSSSVGRLRGAQSESCCQAPGQHPSLPRQLLALLSQDSCCHNSVYEVPRSISKDTAVPLTQRAANAARVHTPGAAQLQVNGSWRLRERALTVR